MSEELKTFNDLEFEQTEEEDNEQTETPSSKRRIYTEQGDPEIESLHGKYKRGKLVVQPDFQRHFVWDVSKASRLIESALLDIPLPIIYLSEGKDGKEYVIDGQQRLTSFFSFIDGQFPNRKDFRLSGLKVFAELNKKSFKDITDDLQDKIRYYKIRTITFRKESESDLRFEIFERLNTGAVSLNDQELRNCIYRGPYNELLKELSQDKDFMHVLGLGAPDKRMKDVELILRFAAFYHATYLKYKSPIKKFLNQDMEDYNNISDEKATQLKKAFKNSVIIIKSLLDTHAFKRFYKGNDKKPDGYWETKRFNAALYDMLMYSFAEIDKNQVYPYLDAIREALIYLMTTDNEFIELIEISTSSPQSVTRRFDKWRQTLQNIIGFPSKGPRCFSFKLKQELYNLDPTCSICSQRILNIDDAAIDHIEQYWMGGKTIPENARLTHRYCNAARPRKDSPILGHSAFTKTDNLLPLNNRTVNTIVERDISAKLDEGETANEGIPKPTANWSSTQKFAESSQKENSINKVNMPLFKDKFQKAYDKSDTIAKDLFRKLVAGTNYNNVTHYTTDKPDYRLKKNYIFCQYVLRQKDIQIELRIDSYSLFSSLLNLEEIRDHTRPGTKWVKFKIFAEDQLDEAIGLIKQAYELSD